MLKDQKEELIKLFVVAGKAHESAFADRDGEDEDWPLWYAEFLKEKINKLLNTKISLSNLVYFLIQFENERNLWSENSEWTSFYSERLINKIPLYAIRNDIEQISLFYATYCPFCASIMEKIKTLKIKNIILRDIYDNSGYHQELINERGKAIVPALKIRISDKNEIWYVDPNEIIVFLENSFSTKEGL